MRKLYFLLLCVAVPFFVSGQYGNEWINYSQKYYKIKVAKDGIYRIDSTTLANAGIPLSTIDPRKFQLFYHGQEQYIYIKNKVTGVFKTGDYIEFYGEHNTGALHKDVSSDSLLYTIALTTYNTPIKVVPNPYYSMYNDTSTYFLTWDTTINNHRVDTTIATNFSSYGPAPCFTAKSLYIGDTGYFEGYRQDIDGDGITDPRYTPAEGWFIALSSGNTYGNASSSWIPLAPAVTNVYTSGPAAHVSTFIANETTNYDSLTVSGSWSGSPVATWSSFANTFSVAPLSWSVNASKLTGSGGFYLQFNNILNTTGLSYISVQYPHTPNMGGALNYMLYVNDTSLSNTYLKLTGLGIATTDSVRLYDLTNHRRMEVIYSGGSYNVLVPNSGSVKQCYLTSESQVNYVTSVKPAGNGGVFTQYSASVGSKPAYVFVTHPTLISEVHQYAQYRSAKFDTVVADVEQLYDQFCYGIEKDPLAIRNFCNYGLNKWKNKPGYLFLVGKGIHEDLWRHNDTNYAEVLVPSIGRPSSDVMLTTGLISGPGISPLKPAIPTGRLSARTATDVANYLAKAQTYEGTKPALWQKNIAHFCGGSGYAEQTQFADYLSIYAGIAVDTFFGARVFTFTKTTSSPIDITLADSVTQLINNGVSVMTFFGHASGNDFDINLDAPSDYNNVGKYPLIIADACFSGDIFQPVGIGKVTTSEEFVLDKVGSIGFLAVDDIGDAPYLFNYTDSLYYNFCKGMYRKPLGNCIQRTINGVGGADGTTGLLTDYTCLEMTLHGDPAIAINANDTLPDYAVNDSSLFFTPTNVTTQVDSFLVNVVVTNNAKAKKQPVQVEIDRFYPNNTKVPYLVTAKNGIYNRDTLKVEMLVDKVKGVGLNYFSVTVNPSMYPDTETTYLNNNITKQQLLISSGDIIPVYPYNYSIIPRDTATLKACTGDPFASPHSYIFQLDTTDGFNTPFLKTQVIYNAKGGVVNATWRNWTSTPGSPTIHPLSIGPTGIGTHPTGATGAPITFRDSTVYYWRVRRDTSDAKDYGWLGSSFQYIKGKAGWGQSHYFQFRNNQYNFMYQDFSRRDWRFSPTAKLISCQTYGGGDPNSSGNWWHAGYFIDLNVLDGAGCGYTPALYVAVIDSITLTPWEPIQHPGINAANSPANSTSDGCTSIDSRFMFFTNNPTQLAALDTMLKDSVPNGDYILVWSWFGSYIRSWNSLSKNSLLNEFKKLGGATVSNIATTKNDSIPWIFFVQKGNVASARSVIGATDTSAIILNDTLKNHTGYGSMTTPIIGPAQKWDSISWRQHPLLKNAHDSVKLNVIGIDPYGNPKTLISGITPAMANLYITSINTKQYPGLQFMLYTKDPVTLTPSQMNKWQVFYTPVPEVAVNPAIYSYFYKNNISGDDTVRFKTVVQNIGDYPMDSMVVSSWIYDAHNNQTFLPVKHTKKLNPGDTTMLSLKISSNGYNGNNSVWFNVNPQFATTTRPEQYYFNDYAKQSFVATGDNHAPLLDVTFDGVHILNNDIVSPHPGILMEIVSDNKNVPLGFPDTGKIAIYLRNITNPNTQRVYIQNNPQMQFTPAVLPNNRCKLLYNPTLADGTYELQVQAEDVSGNPSATRNYTIDFQVINKSMITNVVNYPNPFSTATRFVFTITGDELPTYFKIQIMTITGRVVREITEDELGPLHIGRNITEYAWDGTDQFGDRLANGIYLYRVVTSINSQSIEHMATDADSYFKMGMGKMYLLR